MNPFNKKAYKMKTLFFEIPTMTRTHKQREVTDSIIKLGVAEIRTQRGKAEITCLYSLLKVEIIKAIEEAGYIVKY